MKLHYENLSRTDIADLAGILRQLFPTGLPHYCSDLNWVNSMFRFIDMQHLSDLSALNREFVIQCYHLMRGDV